MNQMNAERFNWTEYLVGENLLFGLLGKMIYSPPEAEWLQGLIEEEVFNEAPAGMDQADTVKGLEYLQAWTAASKPQIRAEQVSELHVDHLRLFVGAGKVLAPPWESVHASEERLLFQKETLQVRGWFHRYGLQSERQYQEPDDHIALELLFLAHLAGLALEALSAQDQARFEALVAAQDQFLNEHLNKWAVKWCDLVLEHAHTDFYRGTALLVRGALAGLNQALEAVRTEDLVQ